MDALSLFDGFGVLLADTLLKGALLLALASLGMWVLRHLDAPSSLRRTSWGVTFVFLLFLPLSTVLLPHLSLTDSLLKEAGSVGERQESGATRLSRSIFLERSRSAERVESNASSIASEAESDLPSQNQSTASPPADSSDSSWPWASLLVGLWAIGALALFTRLAVGICRAHRLRKNDPVTDPAWTNLLAQLRQELDVERPVCLCICDEVDVPMLVGVFRPTILLPSSAQTWTRERRRLVLRHELIHVQQGDTIIGLLARLGRALHWPNPLAWMSWTALRRVQEAACDEALLRAGIQPDVYARQLIGVAREALNGSEPTRSRAAAISMASPVQLKQRIETITATNAIPSAWSTKRKMLLGSIGGALLLAVAALQPLPRSLYPDVLSASPSILTAFEGTSSDATVVEGQIQTLNGKPLPKAHVHVQGPSPDTTVGTGPEGRFEISLHQAGQHYLWVDEKGYRSQGTLVKTGSKAVLHWTTRLAKKSRVIDSLFAKRIRHVGKEIFQYERRDRLKQADSLRESFSQKLHRYYRKNPNTKIGQKAAEEAMVIWGHLGAAGKIEEFLSSSDWNSRIWSLASLFGVRRAFSQSDQYSRSDYFHLLKTLRREVTLPRPRSAVLFAIAHYHSENQNESRNTKTLYKHIIDLDANSSLVKFARGNLRERRQLGEGQNAPAFETSTMNGANVSLSDLRGEVVLLSFWMPPCDPFKDEISHLKAVQSKYGDRDFQILGLALSDSTKHVQQFVEKHGMTWPQIQQEAILDAPLAVRFNIMRVPDTYLIDRNGKIAAKHFEGEAIEENVAALMENGKTPS